MFPDARKNILQRIKKATSKKTPKPFPDLVKPYHLYKKEDELPEVVFAREFTKVNGNFIYCEEEQQFFEGIVELAQERNWNYIHCWDEGMQQVFQQMDFRNCRMGKQLDLAHAGLTRCEALVAHTGSILLSSALPSGRTLTVYPPVHLVLAYTSQLVYSIDDALLLLRKKYGEKMPSFVTLATGPSRTADIEKTLVLGAHGPKEVFVFLVEDEMPDYSEE